ncbi:ATP-binding sensor histidine kinase [Aulosira sp. FACHB-615]|uniref:trifunctional serine/threonine-protein kinase/ATP-binding protein/sensor histidine kinase n=1 Tax=Aulosira sp. FACHB-615 TaxID=2692777 RepID=UPI0016837358|nr:ATP-binding sensor histidine kinase [Aulosira sp. FACHB-615]MBD2487734.1 AAA family ATPase [Aulosira sp. FACHB-615]
MVSTFIPGYEIFEKIHDSPKTRVYRAEQKETHTPVAIKLLNTEYPQFQDLILFRNQYSITRHLEHPNIVKCYSLETYGNSYALILEDFGGISLSQYTQGQILSLDDFFKVAIAVTQALEFLYQNRIIHKDINPNNILINPTTKEVKIIDFSISSLLPKENSEIKSPNILEGTLAYISPEQTGRMNRGIDYRTDFYSLGVTFYQLLTGKLPFNSQNPLELIHCHLAKEAINPKTINSALPSILAEMIMKLMAKTAEERYQTARGIRHDLEVCQDYLCHQGEIIPFKLGQRDRSDRFLIPEKLYGREIEVKTLLDAFERVSLGNIELMLVAGFSGIGKTAVVNEVHKPIVRQQGYFIAGKFDQFQRDIPFSALVQAFRSLMRQLLTETKAQLQTWKSKILLALGTQGQVIIDVIPELEKIIDQQPEVTQLSGNASQNRFNLLFSNFIQVLATQEHPLVIFLDDLQWADAASLKLIQLLLSGTETKYLLVIAAYRDNEVYPGHPFMMALDDIYQAKAIVHQIHLNPLDETQLNCLIADALNCHETQAIQLTQLVLAKTKGNPFFTTQLLKSLHEDGVITFNFHTANWQYDITEAKALYLQDDVVEFVAKQLCKLPQATQEIMKIAACIGNKFDLATLSIVSDKSLVETSADLWKALKEGLILPTNEIYKLFTNDELTTDQTPAIINQDNINVTYKFLHDRVQQAAYYLIPEANKKTTHVTIGKLLLKNTEPEKLEENIFEIVNQLNVGIALIHTQAEKDELAQLNLLAVHKAKSATAYEAAKKYLAVGLELLSLDSWQAQYQLTLNLYTEAVEIEYLNINFDQVEIYANIVRQQAANLLDQVKVYEILMQMYTSKVQMQLAIDTGLQLLDLLGISLESAPPQNLDVTNLINLPLMTAPDKLAAMRILTNMISAAYFTNPGLLPAIIFTIITLAVNYGNSMFAAYGYVLYGLLISALYLEIEAGYRYGEAALNLLDHVDSREIKCRVLLMYNSNVKFWKSHLQETITPLAECLQLGMEVGDIEYALYSASNNYSHLIYVGEELPNVFNQLEKYYLWMCQFEQYGAIVMLRGWQQFALNLMDMNASREQLDGSLFNHAENLAYCLDKKTETSLFNIFLIKTLLFYLFKQPHNAVENAVIGLQYIQAAVGQYGTAKHNFYYSLALLADYHNQPDSKKAEYMQQVLANQQKMKVWAENAPMNFQHKYDLIEAETARVLGNNWQAVELYESAVQGAKVNGYIQEEAIANELAAEFYLACGKEKIAQPYLIDAYYCYTRWGAKVKVADLEKRHHQLLAKVINNQIKNTQINSFTSPITVDANTTNVSDVLDLETVTQASLAIASEIHLDKLLQKLMQVIIENVGADKSALMLQEDDELRIVVQCHNHLSCEIQSTLATESKNIPLSLINYVSHTRENVLINDASADRHFAADPYILHNKPKSILCTPILNQGQLIGIIYLENTLTVGVFTPDRLQILKLLVSQAAISLEIAQLYAKLEEKVAARTQDLNEKNLRLEQTLYELKCTQSQLIQTEKMSGLGQMVAGVAHEINNPVNFIYANIEPASDYVDSLLELIAAYQQEYPNVTPNLEQIIAEIDLEFLIEDLQKILSSMKVGADRIRKIVLGLRNFSRLDEADMKPVDIHEGIDNSLMLLQPRFKGKTENNVIQVIKNYGQLPLVNCYASQMNQVFMNILSNAIDALHEMIKERSQLPTAPQITITTQAINHHWVRISIQDNGIGINEAVKPRIFDPFFTTKPVGGGTGIGLTTSYQIVVEQHKGKIECISESGKGAEFILEIPVG